MSNLIKKLNIACTRYTFKIRSCAHALVTKHQQVKTLAEYANILRDETINCAFPGTAPNILLSAVLVAEGLVKPLGNTWWAKIWRVLKKILNVACKFLTGQDEDTAKKNSSEKVSNICKGKRTVKVKGGRHEKDQKRREKEKRERERRVKPQWTW